MNALTKVFVVLHVVLSMILTAGLVVFVNRTEDFKKLNDGLKSDVAVSRKALSDNQAELAVVRADMAQKINDKQTENATLRDAVTAAQTEAGNLNAKIAELTSQVSQLTAAGASANEALKVAQKANETIQANYAELRKSQDTLQKQFTDANLHINDLQNKLDVTVRHDRMLAEENTQLTSDLGKAREVIHAHNLDGPGGAPRAVVDTPTVNINGVVQDKRVIQGVTYATISIGSADQVRKGTQFKVVDQQNNKFLGYLTVDSVEPHEATGHLDGPYVKDVRPGVEVRTQL